MDGALRHHVGGILRLVQLIREHGDAVEADLALRGIDLRDLFRPGSGLTFRRLLVIIRGLPADASTWSVVREAEEKALKPTPEQIRARAEHYRRQAEEAPE